MPITINLVSNDTDADNNINAATILIAESPSNGSVKVDANGSVTYIPNKDYYGTDYFTYTVSDLTGLVSNEANVSFIINPINDIPVTKSLVTNTDEDTNLTKSLEQYATDADGQSDIVIYTIETSATNGAVSITNGVMKYVPNEDFYGIDNFSFSVTDSNGSQSNISTVNINIAELNDIPVANSDEVNTTEDSSVNIDVLGNDEDDGDLNVSTLTILNQPSNGSVTVEVNGTITYTPDSNWYGTDTFGYTVKDDGLATTPEENNSTGELITNEGIVTINVSSINDAPVAVNDNFTFDEDNTFMTNIHSNDIDVDNNLTGTYISITTPPSNGVVTVMDSGLVQYIPTKDYSGVDSFGYKISDGDINSSEATVSLTINSTNDTPSFATLKDHSITENNTSTIVTLVANDIDDEDSSLIYSIVDGKDSAFFTLSGSNLSFTNGMNFELPEDDNSDNIYSVDVRVNDDENSSIAKTLNITVTNISEDDTDGDGISDDVDSDDDNDGIPDAIEGNDDTDGDGIPDSKDNDSDNDGISDKNEGNTDTDGDGIVDYKDPDSDDDGIADKDEGTIDTDGDTVSNYKDLDSDDDGILDKTEGTIDTDGDTVPNYIDLDSDNDGKPDTIEGTIDDDQDSIPNYIDPNDNGGTKDNGDGTSTTTIKKGPGDGDDDTTSITVPNGTPSDTVEYDDNSTNVIFYDPNLDINISNDGDMIIVFEGENDDHNVTIDRKGVDVNITDGNITIITPEVINSDGTTCVHNLTLSTTIGEMISKHTLGMLDGDSIITTIVMQMPNASINITEDNRVENKGHLDNNINNKTVDVTASIDCTGAITTLTDIEDINNTFIASNKAGSKIIINEYGNVDVLTAMEQDPNSTNKLQGLSFKVDSLTGDINASKVFKATDNEEITYTESEVLIAGSTLLVTGTSISEVDVSFTDNRIVEVGISTTDSNTITSLTSIDNSIADENITRSNGANGMITTQLSLPTAQIVIDNVLNGKVKHSVVKNNTTTEAYCNLEGADINATSGGVTTTYNDDDIVAEARADVDGLASHRLTTNGKVTEVQAQIIGATTVIDYDSNNTAKIVTKVDTLNENNQSVEIEVDANSDGSAIHKVAINGIVTKATCKIEGAKTTIQDNGEVETNSTISLGTIAVIKALPDGTSTNEMKNSAFTTSTTSKIAGSETTIKTNGDIEVSAGDIDDGGYIIKALAIIQSSGTTITRFVKVSNSDESIIEVLGNTMEVDTPYKEGNTVEIDKINSIIYIKTTTPLDADLVVE